MWSQNLEHAERMAKRTTRLLLEYSDMRRYAGDVDLNLAEVVSQLQPMGSQAEFRFLTPQERVAVFGVA